MSEAVQEGSAAPLFSYQAMVLSLKEADTISISPSPSISAAKTDIAASALVAISEAVKEAVPPPDIATLVTTPVIDILGAGFMASVNVAVIVTVSEAASRLSASVSVRVTLTLELHTPHSGCLEASFLHVALALVLKA